MLFDCPFCHHQHASLYRQDQEYRSGGFGTIYTCTECGVLYPRPRLDKSEVLDCLSKVDTNQITSQFDDPTIPIKKGKLFSLLERLPRSLVHRNDITLLLRKWIKPKGNALDIGAFTGRFCYLLKTVGFRAYGLEPQEKASRFAREKGLDVFTGNFPDNISPELLNIKFTLISLQESNYYFVNLKKSLLEINDMLVPDGFLLIKCHQGKSRYYKNGNSLFKRFGDNVQGIPTLNSMRYCLKSTGFEIVQIVGLPVSVNLSFLDKYICSKYLVTGLKKMVNLIQGLTMFNINNADRFIVLAKKREEICLN
jgi:SAM-dependent methyltransferase|tara:strand:- start:461 stop:1387 length:927 start_codon:yes stop_codon:yes gene_type:complete